MKMREPAQSALAFWRDDIDSLAFYPIGHKGQCVIHRRAFRTLLGFLPEPRDCLAYFEAQRDIFQRAAEEKVTRASVQSDESFHLNSRDIRAVRGSNQLF
jgi:hypothetical protein